MSDTEVPPDEEEIIADDAALADIEALIAEEDPDFLNQLNEIAIDNDSVDLSLMEQVLTGTESLPKPPNPFFEEVKKMFQIRSNPKQVLFFWMIVVLIGGAVVYVIKYFPWGKNMPLFLRHYGELGLPINPYNPLSESEFFFDNSRVSKNMVSLKKMVVNLKASASSTSNPMLAFEITVEGLSKEVVIEIKDREAEFKDLVLRTAEDYSYDELTEPQGKQGLAERILLTLNSQLTQGQVRRVFYRTFILKN
jgi:flagellar basal body-associated protein FliL